MQDSCFFIGHHDAPDTIQEQLNEVVEFLIKHCGVTEFIVGYHGSFDRMAKIAVQKAKARRPEIWAKILQPYHPAECKLPIPDFFDGTYYPKNMEDVPRRFAIKRANQIAVDGSDFLIAYVRSSDGNASAILRRAQEMEKLNDIRIVNLAVDQNWEEILRFGRYYQKRG